MWLDLLLLTFILFEEYWVTGRGGGATGITLVEGGWGGIMRLLLKLTGVVVSWNKFGTLNVLLFKCDGCLGVSEGNDGATGALKMSPLLIPGFLTGTLLKQLKNNKKVSTYLNEDETSN